MIALHDSSGFVLPDRGGAAGEATCAVVQLDGDEIAVPLFSYGD